MRKEEFREIEKLKTLPPVLERNGFRYTLVLRGKRLCIYQQEVTKDVCYFEVFLIKTRPERQLCGKTLPAQEIFPNDEAFGYWAWSYRKYEHTFHRFTELENGYKRSYVYAKKLNEWREKNER
jgi:hypothetical protein